MAEPEAWQHMECRLPPRLTAEQKSTLEFEASHEQVHERHGTAYYAGMNTTALSKVAKEIRNGPKSFKFDARGMLLEGKSRASFFTLSKLHKIYVALRLIPPEAEDAVQQLMEDVAYDNSTEAALKAAITATEELVIGKGVRAGESNLDFLKRRVADRAAQVELTLARGGGGSSGGGGTGGWNQPSGRLNSWNGWKGDNDWNSWGGENDRGKGKGKKEKGRKGKGKGGKGKGGKGKGGKGKGGWWDNPWWKRDREEEEEDADEGEPSSKKGKIKD